MKIVWYLNFLITNLVYNRQIMSLTLMDDIIGNDKWGLFNELYPPYLVIKNSNMEVWPVLSIHHVILIYFQFYILMWHQKHNISRWILWVMFLCLISFYNNLMEFTRRNTNSFLNDSMNNWYMSVTIHDIIIFNCIRMEACVIGWVYIIVYTSIFLIKFSNAYRQNL